MIFWYRPLPRKLLLALTELTVSCFTKYLKRCERCAHFFCAYLHGMYDYTRLTRAIVCGEIDLCWNFERGFRRRISNKKKSWLYFVYNSTCMYIHNIEDVIRYYVYMYRYGTGNMYVHVQLQLYLKKRHHFLLHVSFYMYLYHICCTRTGTAVPVVYWLTVPVHFNSFLFKKKYFFFICVHVCCSYYLLLCGHSTTTTGYRYL